MVSIKYKLESGARKRAQESRPCPAEPQVLCSALCGPEGPHRLGGPLPQTEKKRG